MGYFKATQLFHEEIIFDEHQADFKFISESILGESNLKFTGKLGYDSKINQRKQITKYLDFSFWKELTPGRDPGKKGSFMQITQYSYLKELN